MHSKTFVYSVTTVVLSLSLGVPAVRAETFLKSDDYEDGEEIVNVFLKEDDYRLMVEDIERNGEGFDWGWVKTAAEVMEPVQETPEKKGRLGRLLRLPKRGGGRPAQPGVLGFDLSAYKSVALSVKNFAGVVPPKSLDAVREAFTLALEQMGLQAAPEGAKADLELGIAIVDMKRDSTYIYFGNVDPFIELEVRLRDTAAGGNLILLRNQAHSNTPEEAALNYASTLVKFLR